MNTHVCKKKIVALVIAYKCNTYWARSIIDLHCFNLTGLPCLWNRKLLFHSDKISTNLTGFFFKNYRGKLVVFLTAFFHRMFLQCSLLSLTIFTCYYSTRFLVIHTPEISFKKRTIFGCSYSKPFYKISQYCNKCYQWDTYLKFTLLDWHHFFELV